MIPITRPVSGSCLDHIYSNHSQRIRNVICHNIGLADHLPIFVVRKYARENFNCHPGKPASIKYRDIQRFNQEQFVEALRQAPWDTAFVFEEIDDVLNGWEQIFNSVVGSFCPWREKRI